MIERLLEIFRNKDRVTVPAHVPSYKVLDVRDGVVGTVWSSSPEDYSPYSIDFLFNGRKYDLIGAWKLKAVCKAYKRHGSGILFTARLYLEDREIVRVEELN